MQVISDCAHPNLFPAIIHKDGTSRVQTVPKDGSGIRELLEKWFVLTGCPMLLNTSLNVRGEPMVNNREDADRFKKLYGVKVLS
jgi:carbamoyltransferase